MEFVFAHPNAWEGQQQSQMRTAAIIAGLIPNSPEGHERTHFVTEGEASLRFCVNKGLAADPLRLGKGVIVVDAGGGTVDISTYRKIVAKEGQEEFEEIAPAQCLFSGSVFVSNRAQEYLQAKLRGSKWEADVGHIRECFDKTAKLRFRGTEQWSFIKFGRPGDRDADHNIAGGQLKLSRDVVAGFFKPSLDAIVKCIKEQQAAAHAAVSSVLLVGGFAASDWLYSQLRSSLQPLGLEISRPDFNVNKAVADGAVSFYLDHFVSARISKHTHGIEIYAYYDAGDAEHRARTTSVDAAGLLLVSGRFSDILNKNTRVCETTEFRKPYIRHRKTILELLSVEIPIIRYTGEDTDPRWIDIEREKYPTVCRVTADTSRLANTLEPLRGSNGIYYRLSFEVILSFGLTELKAQIAWKENGEEKRGPAQIVYN